MSEEIVEPVEDMDTELIQFCSQCGCKFSKKVEIAKWHKCGNCYYSFWIKLKSNSEIESE